MENSRSRNLAIVGVLALLVVIPLTAYVLLSNTFFGNRAAPAQKKPVLNFVSNTTATSWPVYKSTAFGYSIAYPPEFTVEDRGKVGSLLSLVAFNYQDGNKRITVAKVEISAGKSPATVQVSKGLDGNGNDVAVYVIPYTTTRTLTLLGTNWPTVNSSFLFGQTLELMANSVKVTAK